MSLSHTIHSCWMLKNNSVILSLAYPLFLADIVFIVSTKLKQNIVSVSFSFGLLVSSLITLLDFRVSMIVASKGGVCCFCCSRGACSRFLFNAACRLFSLLKSTWFFGMLLSLGLFFKESERTLWKKLQLGRRPVPATDLVFSSCFFMHFG